VIGEDLLGAGGQEGDEVGQSQGHQVAVRRCVQRLGIPAKSLEKSAKHILKNAE